MNKIIIAALLTIILIISAFSSLLWFRYKNLTAAPPDKIEILTGRLTGTGKLILAEENVYQEYIKKYEKGPAKAAVLFRWLSKFQYMVDLQNPQFVLKRSGNNIEVTAPAIQLNNPIINISRYKPGLVIEGSIWLNESKLINDEMQNFNSVSLTAGLELLKNPVLIKLCKDQLKLAVLEIASGLQIQVNDVEISFSDE